MNSLFQSMLDYTFRCDKCGSPCPEHFLRFVSLRDRHEQEPLCPEWYEKFVSRQNQPDDNPPISDAEIDTFLASWAGCLNCSVCEKHALEASPLVVYGLPPRMACWMEFEDDSPILNNAGVEDRRRHGGKFAALYWYFGSTSGMNTVPTWWLAL